MTDTISVMNLVVDDLHVRGSDEGSGKAALLLHGWGNDHSSFNGLAETLSGYRLIAPDLPGFGGSQPPPSAWGVADYAQFVSHLLDKLEIKRLDLLIGHSFGGRIALELAGSGRLEPGKLVLMSSHGLPEPRTAKSVGIGLLARLGKVLPASVRGRFGAKLASADYQAASGVMRDVLKKVISQDATERARAINLPTLLIYGSEDEVTPPAMGRRLAGLINGAELAIVPEAGHFVHLEQPTRTGRLIKDFLA